MLSRTVSKVLRYSCRKVIPKSRVFSSQALQSEKDRDPAPLFFDETVQKALFVLTRVNHEKVFRVRKYGVEMYPPEYKFVTDEELKEEREKVHHKTKELLQMPPVVKEREEIDTVISKDPALQGLDTCNFVFTDITFGKKDKERIIVIREPNGLLRKAYWEERHRANYAYFPLPGRELKMPQMFKEEYLRNLINSKEYEFILDRACVQFDPDDSDFHRVCQEVYLAVNKAKDYDILRSTRHFGPLAFHLVWNKNMDDLLCDLIRSGKTNEISALVQLFYIIHPPKTPSDVLQNTDYVRQVVEYANFDSCKKDTILKSLEAHLEIKKINESTEVNESTEANKSKEINIITTDDSNGPLGEK